MSEETPLTRLEKIVDMMERMVDDVEIIYDMAQHDPEVMRKLSEFMVRLINVVPKIQMRVVKAVVNR